MIGIFDSGVGGFISLRRLRELCPRADICYLADRKNAPYGTKSEEELRRLVLNDISLLRRRGADRILAACCTASAVLDAMGVADVTTIIRPTARLAARQTKNRKVAVICTYATARSGAFARALLEINPRLDIKTQPSRRLVELAELRVCDGNITEKALEAVRGELRPLMDFGADTVILGCTHFSLLGGVISELLCAKTVSAADVGAELIARSVSEHGEGKTVYICPEKII